MFKSLIERYVRYKKYRETYNALQDLSDHELRDIGLTRGTIRRVAAEHTNCLDENDNLRGWV